MLVENPTRAYYGACASYTLPCNSTGELEAKAPGPFNDRECAACFCYGEQKKIGGALTLTRVHAACHAYCRLRGFDIVDSLSPPSAS